MTLSNLNVKEDMILYAATVYDFSSNGFNIGTLDLQNAIKYYEYLTVKDNVVRVKEKNFRGYSKVKISLLRNYNLEF